MPQEEREKRKRTIALFWQNGGERKRNEDNKGKGKENSFPSSIYTYKTEAFEAPTNFHVSTILKKKHQSF